MYAAFLFYSISGGAFSLEYAGKIVSADKKVEKVVTKGDVVRAQINSALNPDPAEGSDFEFIE